MSKSEISTARIRVFGILGSIGMLIGIAADVVTSFTAEGWAGVFEGPLLPDRMYAIYLFLTAGRTMAGHYHALIGIPMGLFGLFHIHLVLRRSAPRLSMAALVTGTYGFILGTVFHASLGFVALMMQTTGSVPSAARVMFEPWVAVCLVLMMISMAFVLFILAGGQSPYPKTAVLAHPFMVQLVCLLLMLTGGTFMKAFLMVTVYNLSLLVFFLYSTVLHWNFKPDE